MKKALLNKKLMFAFLLMAREYTLEVMEPKSAIRDRGRKLRAEIDSQLRAMLDEQIVERCKTALDWATVGRVMVFLPIERHHEINTWPLVQWIWQAHPQARVYAPRIVERGLEAVRITPESVFLENSWGVPEPAGGPVLGAGEGLDLVLTPLLAFDEHGHRVGYGRGYYDRFFAAHATAQRVGLGYEGLLVHDGIAGEPHDVLLQAVITERRVYRRSAETRAEAR